MRDAGNVFVEGGKSFFRKRTGGQTGSVAVSKVKAAAPGM
jgi:hypothetical protein